jgi:DNA polymerase-3 subunit gamma/tau
MARILAEALNCEKGPTAEPCGTCDICTSIHRGEDVDVLEIDGASNTGVDDVRTLRENAYYRPARARYKIYYIDEVHMLSTNAFNALLKILEEPPEHVLFLFSTTNPEKLPATILSRCQRFDFRAVPTERIAEHLANICKQEKVKADAEALLAIAREGRGSVRDALTLLDQAIAVGGGKVTIEAVRDSVGAVSGDQMLALLAACADGDAGGALRKFSDLLAGGADVLALLDQCIRLVRDLLVVKTCGSDVELVDVFGPDPKALAAEAKKLSVPALVAAMGYLVEARSRARWAADGRPVAELAVVRLASLAEMEPLPEVLARLDRLQQSLLGGSSRPAPQPAADEKKKHGLSENEGRVPGEAEEPGAEPPDAPTQAEIMPPDQKAEGQERPSLPPREPVKRRKLDEAMMDPLIQKAIRLFDGRIVNIED